MEEIYAEDIRRTAARMAPTVRLQAKYGKDKYAMLGDSLGGIKHYIQMEAMQGNNSAWIPGSMVESAYNAYTNVRCFKEKGYFPSASEDTGIDRDEYVSMAQEYFSAFGFTFDKCWKDGANAGYLLYS